MLVSDRDASETAESVAEKKFSDLTPLTPGSELMKLICQCFIHIRTVHGYSMLRTQLNNNYFHDLFNLSAQFDVAIEGHRKYFIGISQRAEAIHLYYCRHRNRTWRFRDRSRIYLSSENGGQRYIVQIHC